MFERDTNEAQLSQGTGVRLAVCCAVLALAAFGASGCAARAPEPGESLEAFTARLNRRIPVLMEQYEVPGLSIALVRGGEVAWSGAYGVADVERSRPMTRDALCRAESISKSLTAWGVMKLVEQGRVNLDDPVQRHLRSWKLPDSGFPEEAVTVRRLLSHSAGMPLGTIGVRYAPEGAVPALREALSTQARPIQQPGSAFLYSNVGFNLLELLIEEVSGRPFAEYMSDEVLAPLGMRDSSFSWNETRRSLVPNGYDLRGTPVPPYVYPEKGSGGLFTTVEDVARFASAEIAGSRGLRNPVLAPESVRRIHAPEVKRPGVFAAVADAYGFGHFVETLPDGRQAVWHGGQGTGWMTHFHVVPESGDGIVILTNSQRSWPLMAVVLRDWARWSGFDSVKMGRITYAVAALRAATALFVLLALWLVLRVLCGVRRGERRWAPLSSVSLPLRFAQVAFGAAVMAALAWSAAQPYLIISSVCPGIADWAGRCLFVLAAMLVVSAIFPRTEAKDRGRALRVDPHPALSEAGH